MKVHAFCSISCVSRHPAPNWQHLRPRFLRRRHEVAGMPIHMAQDGFNLAWHCPLNLPMWAAQGPQEGPKGSGVQQASAPGQGTSHNWTPQPVAAKGLWAKPRAGRRSSTALGSCSPHAHAGATPRLVAPARGSVVSSLHRWHGQGASVIWKMQGIGLNYC